MDMKQGAKNVLAWIKKRPLLAAAIVFTTIVVVWYVTRPRVSRSAETPAYAGGGMPYILPNQADSGAGLQAQAMELQASVARAQVEAAQTVERERIAAEKEIAALTLTTQGSAMERQFGLAEKALDYQYSPKTYATMEIQQLYNAFGREATTTDLTYWAGQAVANSNYSTILQNELAKDQVVLSNVGVTKSEANTISALYAKQGRIPSQADLAYWGNFQGDMEKALSYQLEYDARKTVTG